MGAKDQVVQREGYFGRFGGRFVPETLVPAHEQLAREYESAKADPVFQQEYRRCLREIAGRPSMLYHARRLGEQIGGAQIYLKREDLNHTGAHKVNNTLGQALLCVRMGKRRVIAETGAGQHGVATAMAAAVFGLECDVYMGTEDMRRQALNVFRMRLLGARVVPVESGQRTLKDATNEAMRDWMGSVAHTHYIIGSVVGGHPFPTIVRDFQRCIGDEAREQMLQRVGQLPTAIVACVGGGSNAAGIFAAFVSDPDVRLVGVEAGGSGLSFGKHAASICHGRPGVLHGAMSYILQDDDGQTAPVHSISAGLDYPGVGPEHAYWHDAGRVQYTSRNDEEALDAVETLSRSEGIIPALESAHAVAEAVRLAGQMQPDQAVLINLSGRGDKDCSEIEQLLQRERG